MRLEILQEIDRLNETYCKPCTLVDHSNATAGYQQKLRKHCYGSCEIGAKLRELGKQLADERQRRRNKSSAPVEESPKRKRARRPGQKKRLNPITRPELARLLE